MEPAVNHLGDPVRRRSKRIPIGGRRPLTSYSCGTGSATPSHRGFLFAAMLGSRLDQPLV